jgi:SAM-dependent methyltransferase
MDPSYYREMAAVEDRHWWFEARRRILGAVLDRLTLGPEAEVLEVGCGTGGNLPMLARYGRLHACEPEADARALAEARGLATVAAGGLPDDLPFGGKPFDLIALLDVLEHVAADEASLAALHARLKPGGTLLVTVPAYRFLWSAHDEVNHHVRRYTRGDLVRKLRAAGFHVRRATYFNTLLFPVIATVRLAGRRAGKTGSDLALPGDALNSLLTRIFASERLVVPRLSLPFGVSLLAVAERD